MNEEEPIQELIAAWNAAGRELGIRVIAPFEFKTDLASYKCIAYLPHFGAKKGMLIRAVFPPAFETDTAFSAEAKKAGFFVSLVNAESYRVFDSDKFKEALTDWGFFGPSAMRPEWLV